MSGVLQGLLLFVAGVGGGVLGSVAGLASLASYPALLALGLTPVAANVTNTVASVFSSIGSVTASGPELRGRGRALRPLLLAGMVGGTAGAALLLLTPPRAFEVVVPVLVALASVTLLVGRRVVRAPREPGERHGAELGGVGAVGVYAGYFGAGAGVMLLSLFLHTTREDLAHANAMKNVVLGVSNGIAAVGFLVFGPVAWWALAPLGLGLFVGGRLGPPLVRRAPPERLRVAIALAGFVLAARLALSAW